MYQSLEVRNCSTLELWPKTRPRDIHDRRAMEVICKMRFIVGDPITTLFKNLVLDC